MCPERSDFSMSWPLCALGSSRTALRSRGCGPSCFCINVSRSRSLADPEH